MVFFVKKSVSAIIWMFFNASSYISDRLRRDVRKGTVLNVSPTTLLITERNLPKSFNN